MTVCRIGAPGPPPYTRGPCIGFMCLDSGGLTVTVSGCFVFVGFVVSLSVRFLLSSWNFPNHTLVRLLSRWASTMRYPLAAPLLLLGAGLSVLVGTLHKPLAPLAFGFCAPIFFLSLNLVMLAGAGFALSLPSVLLISGSVLTLTGSVCKASGMGEIALCSAVVSTPPLVLRMLAFSGPALLTWRLGANPVLLTWLGSTAVGVVPALPPHIRELVWQPGVVSGALILACSYFMMRTRVNTPDPDPNVKAKSA